MLAYMNTCRVESHVFKCFMYAALKILVIKLLRRIVLNREIFS